MSNMSLSRKLYRFRYTLAHKQKMILNSEQIDLITRHKPTDMDTLRTKCAVELKTA